MKYSEILNEGEMITSAIRSTLKNHPISKITASNNKKFVITFMHAVGKNGQKDIETNLKGNNYNVVGWRDSSNVVIKNT